MATNAELREYAKIAGIFLVGAALGAWLASL